MIAALRQVLDLGGCQVRVALDFSTHELDPRPELLGQPSPLVMRQMRHAAQYGLADTAPVFSFPSVMQRVQAVIRAIAGDHRELYLGWPERFFVRLNSLLPNLIDRSLRKHLPLIRRLSQKTDNEDLNP